MAGPFDGEFEAGVAEVGRGGVSESAAVPDRDHHARVELGEDRLEFVAAHPEVLGAFVVEPGRRVVDVGGQHAPEPIFQRLRLDEHVGHGTETTRNLKRPGSGTDVSIRNQAPDVSGSLALGSETTPS